MWEFSGLACKTHIAHIAHIARSGLACKTHIVHIAHIARSPGSVGVQRVGVPPHVEI